MRNSVGRLLVWLVAALMVAPTLVSAQVLSDPRKPAGRDWPTVGGDWGNSRYSTLSQINAENVSRLGGAWMARLNGSGMDDRYSQQATPIFKDGVLYVPTGQQDVFALDPKTGSIIWEYDSDVNPRSQGSWRNRGVAVAEGKVFTIRKDGFIQALNQQTGKLIWSVPIGAEGAGPGTLAQRYLSNALVYFDGLILTGLSGSDSGVRGRITALDVNTGAEVWHFDTIPGPGQPFHETWEGESWTTGGGGVWMHPAIDGDLGIAYFPVGNAWPDYDGSVRGGDNLFTGSILALDVKTGAYKWHFQEVHHEIWDYDAANTPLLFETVIDGRTRKGLAHPGKTGWIYLLDRATGEPLLGMEERPVLQDPRQKTSATQPFPVGDTIVPQCATDPLPGFVPGCIFQPFWDIPIWTEPGSGGGADYAPMSFSPLTNMFYVGGSIRPSAYSVLHEGIGADGKRVALGGIGNARPLGTKLSGTLNAVDASTNRLVWQKKVAFPAGAGSGFLSTAGGLVFTGQSDGNVIALDARTGNELWRFQTGFGADGPVMTFEIDGEQYLVIATGGNAGYNSARGDAVWAFKIGGPLRPLNPPPAPPTVVALTGAPVKVDAVTIGRLWDSDKAAPGVEAEYAFGPERIQVPAGTTVTWTNEGTLEHTATDQAGNFDSGPIQPGQSKTVTFDKAGSYIYFCQPHPWMIAQVLVS